MDANTCWSCGKPGSAVVGKSWKRQCRECDVTWDTRVLLAPSLARQDQWNRERYEDQVAEKFGLGDRSAFVDHATVKLASPA